MKILTLIVHTDSKEALADTLHTLPQVTGFTFSPVEGHGPHEDRGPSLSARDRVVGYVPHVRVDLILEDTDVDKVLETLKAADNGVAGRGVYWVTRLERQGRL